MRSPQRVHVLAALEAIRQGTLAELAAVMGRTRQSLHPHLTAMAEAGIIGRTHRIDRGRSVAVFQFLPRKLQGSVRERTGEGVRQAAMVSARALVDAQLRCRRWGALDDRRPIDLTSNPEAYTSVRVTWLDDRSRARLNGLLRQVSSVLREGCIARKGRRTCVLIYHFPDYTASEARMLRANSPTPRSPKRQSL
jgi:hypothetical protein